MTKKTRTFEVVEVLDGQWSGGQIVVAEHDGGAGIRIVGIDAYTPPPPPKNPEAIQMVLAFQMTPGKTRAEFATFKKLDFPWVIENQGCNRATIWTERSAAWPFDAFEDVIFASKTDFQRAYAGTPELAKAGEGLFGDKVLVAIVKEK